MTGRESLAVSFGKSLVRPQPNNSWLGLIKALEKLGLRIWDVSDNFEPTHWLAVDYDPSTAKRFRKISPACSALVLSEPATVLPKQYTSGVMGRFSKRIFPSANYPEAGDGTIWEGGYFDTSTDSVSIWPNNGNRSGSVMLNQNKFSLIAESNYALRARFVRAGIDAGIDLSVGGKDWDRGLIWTFAKILHQGLIAIDANRIPSLSGVVPPLPRKFHSFLRGSIEDGARFLSNYAVAIVIENESSAVSEKLFLSILAGCKCVYVGPRIDLSQFPKGSITVAQPNALAVAAAVRSSMADTYSVDWSTLHRWATTSPFCRKNSTELRNNSMALTIKDWATSL